MDRFSDECEYIPDKPGDFKQFFADPRTRADYLEWAAYLLEAEEYHAGNRDVHTPVDKVPRVKNKAASHQYYQRKRRKSLVGRAVRLTRNVTMKNGTVYLKGSLWRIYRNTGKIFAIHGIEESGKESDPYRVITNMEEYDMELDSTIPPAPKKTKEIEDDE